MILRPLTPAPPSDNAQPVWDAIEAAQTATLPTACWMIPQPAHAALSGEIATRLDSRIFPGLTDDVVRGISLHDAGWGPIDAVAIQESRSKAPIAPRSFVQAAAKTVYEAWAASIGTAEKASPLAGYLVSRHFLAIFEHHPEKLEPFTERFRKQETARQQRLMRTISADDGQVEALVETLQFCDLLSLYICCGLRQAVEFPQAVVGQRIRLQSTGEASCRLIPSAFSDTQNFSICAVRHPGRGNAPSSVMFPMTIE